MMVSIYATICECINLKDNIFLSDLKSVWLCAIEISHKNAGLLLTKLSFF
jgi:hypothetical protein